MQDDPRWGDDPRDTSSPESSDRDRNDERSPGRGPGTHDRDRPDRDPRDVFVNHVDLPRGMERERVYLRERHFDLRGSESRTLCTIGAFRVVPAGDLCDAA